ncbi:MAG: hypothetical protein AB7F86_07170 [Bdellovibrionales bacterium]
MSYRKLKILGQATGYSLVSVLVASALLGFVVVGVTSLIDTVTKAMARASITQVVEAAVRSVQAVVANEELCGNALRGPGGSGDRLVYLPANWGTDLPVDSIYVQRRSADPNATLLLKVGQSVSDPASPTGRILVKSAADGGIVFRERVPGQGRLRVEQSPGRFLTVMEGEIVIRFDVATGAGAGGNNTVTNPLVLSGGAIREKRIPYNAVIDESTNRLTKCYQESAQEAICLQLGGTYVANAPAGQNRCQRLLKPFDFPDCGAPVADGGIQGDATLDCPGTSPGTPPESCTKFYFVEGYRQHLNTDAAAEPICRCQWICMKQAPGATPAAPGPGPGPGPYGPGSPGGSN